MLTDFALLGLSPIASLFAEIVLLAVLVFEIWMIYSALTNDHLVGNTRVLWVVGMLLIHPFVAIAYYFTDYKKA